MNTTTYNTMLRDFAQVSNAMNQLVTGNLTGYDYARNGGARPGVHGNGNGSKTNGASQPTVKAHLPLDAQATDDAYVFIAYLPGVKPEEVELTFEKDVLTVRGQFPTKPESEKGWIKQELFHGPFERSLSFNTPVNSDAIEAHFDNGVLTLRVPKIEEAKPKKIAVIAK